MFGGLFGGKKPAAPQQKSRPPVLPPANTKPSIQEPQSGGFFNLPAAGGSLRSTVENAATSAPAPTPANDGGLFGNLNVRGGKPPERKPLPPTAGEGTDLDAVSFKPNPALGLQPAAENLPPATGFDFMSGATATSTAPATFTPDPTSSGGFSFMAKPETSIAAPEAPVETGFGFMDGATTATTLPAAVPSEPTTAGGFDFMGKTDSPAPPSGVTGFGFMTPSEETGPSAAESGDLFSSLSKPSSSKPSTPASDGNLFSDMSASKSTRKPVVVQRNKVVKKKSAKKRIGFERAAAMADLDQQALEETAAPATSAPATSAPATSASPVTTNEGGGSSSLLSGMKIHKKTTDSPPVPATADTTDPAVPTVAESVAPQTYSTFRGSVYNSEEMSGDNNATPPTTAAATPVAEETRKEEDAAPRERRASDVYGDLPAPDPIPGETGFGFMGSTESTENAPAAEAPIEEEPAVDDLETYVKRSKEKFLSLEARQTFTETERDRLQLTIGTYKADLATAEKQQVGAIESEDYEAAERYNVAITDYNKLLADSEAKLKEYKQELADINQSRETIMQDQLLKIESVTSTLEEKELEAKEKLAAFEAVMATRASNDEKRLQVLVQRLSLDEETVLSDSKSLAADRDILEAKMDGETADITVEKAKWVAERTRVQADIDALQAELQKKQEEMVVIVEKVEEHQSNIDRVLEIYAPRKGELEAREKKLREKTDACAEQKERIASTEGSIQEQRTKAEQEHAEMTETVEVLAAEQVVIGIVRNAMQQLTVIREDMNAAVASGEAAVEALLADIKTSKDALAASQQREGEVEATLAECRNRVETLDSKIPNLQGEKKRAVAAKNFKAAGTIAADIKRFTAEKEEAQASLDAASRDLNGLVQDFNAAKEAVDAKESALASTIKSGDMKCLAIARRQRQLIKKANTEVGRTKGGAKTSGAMILTFALTACLNEIQKICAKHGLDDVEEEEENTCAQTTTDAKPEESDDTEENAPLEKPLHLVRPPDTLEISEESGLPVHEVREQRRMLAGNMFTGAEEGASFRTGLSLGEHIENEETRLALQASMRETEPVPMLGVTSREEDEPPTEPREEPGDEEYVYSDQSEEEENATEALEEAPVETESTTEA